MSVATGIVKLAAASLPRALRDRYREQWLADLRDAPELNLRPTQIALGSAAFALTVGRPLTARPDLGAQERERRARLARVIGLGAALVALSQYASMAAGGLYYVGDNLLPDATTWTMATIVFAVAALGSVLSLLLTFGSRGMPTRARGAAVLFAAASAAPVVQSSLSSGAGRVFWYPTLHASALAYLVGAILVIAALVVTRGPRPARRPRLRGVLVAAFAVLLIGAAALIDAIVLWSLRPPLAFGNGPRTLDNPIYADWLRLKLGFEALMTSIFTWWGVGLVALVMVFILLAAASRLAPAEIGRLALGTAGVALLAAGSLLGFVEAAQNTIVPAGEVVLVLGAGRLLLVAATLWAAADAARLETARVHSGIVSRM